MMKTVMAAGLALGLATAANASTVLAEWTFEVSIPVDAGPHAAEGGLFGGNASASHASSATVYSNPVGNGSLESFSSNNWAIGDYYQFETSTIGYENITVQFDQTRSSTGPADFNLFYSVDGMSFSLLASYSISALSWSSLSYNPASTFGAFALPSDAADQASLIIRMVADSAPTQTGGTNRIDDVIVAGTLIPTPGAVALLGLGGLLAARRRRA